MEDASSGEVGWGEARKGEEGMGSSSESCSLSESSVGVREGARAGTDLRRGAVVDFVVFGWGGLNAGALRFGAGFEVVGAIAADGGW